MATKKQKPKSKDITKEEFMAALKKVMGKKSTGK